jgi:hypothetical protein
LPGLSPRSGRKYFGEHGWRGCAVFGLLGSLTTATTIGDTPSLLWLWLWASLLQNGCLQQIAANRFSTPQDVIAILLQGFVLSIFRPPSRR